MAEQAETAFIKTFVNTISTQPVTYSDDYQQPPQNSLSKVPVLSIAVPPAPDRKSSETLSANEELTITFKSTKPAATFTLSVNPTDTIASIKSQLFESTSSAASHAPPPDAQRLLLKGKALVDNKLLKEYPIKAGDTVNLMVKPGFDWDPSASPAPVSSSPTSIASPTPVPPTLQAGPSGGGGKRHQRIPSVVLSPSPSNDTPGSPNPPPVELDIDDAGMTIEKKEVVGSYQEVISQPEFWERLRAFLQSQFPEESDALAAWEEFLRASKGGLTANQIAKIRDHVGVVGMAGV